MHEAVRCGETSAINSPGFPLNRTRDVPTRSEPGANRALSAPAVQMNTDELNRCKSRGLSVVNIHFLTNCWLSAKSL